MNRSDTRFAALIGGAGFIAATLAQLMIFRHSSDVIGLDKIGLVVLLQSILFFTRLLDIGAGPNLTRRLAAAHVTPSDSLFAQELWSSILSISGPTLLISSLALTVIVVCPELVGGVQNEGEVTKIAAALCISGTLSSVVAILIAAHEGIGDLVARGASLILFGVTVLSCGVPLVACLGTLGYALAVPVGLTVQFVALSLNLIWLGARLRPDAMRSTLISARHQLRENLTLNSISVCRLLFEPLTKYLLFLLGTLEIVAVFDVLSKVVTAVRVLVQTMMQPLLFKKSQLHAQGVAADDFGTQRRLDSVAMYFVAGALSSAPVLEALLFGGNAAPHVTFVLVILAVSSAINLSGQIAYLDLLATAAYGILLRIHLAMVVTNLTVSGLFGALLNERGVVLGYAATMALGGIALRILSPGKASVRRYNSPLNAVEKTELILIFGTTIISLYYVFSKTFALSLSVILTVFLALGFVLTVIKPLMKDGDRP